MLPTTPQDPFVRIQQTPDRSRQFEKKSVGLEIVKGLSDFSEQSKSTEQRADNLDKNRITGRKPAGSDGKNRKYLNKDDAYTSHKTENKLSNTGVMPVYRITI